jgi:hypothetical protein
MTVKRLLLVAVAAVMLLSSLAVPTVAHADGGPGGTSCGGNGQCRP